MNAPYGQQPAYATGAPAVAAAKNLMPAAALMVLGGVVAGIGVFLAWLTFSVAGYNISVNGMGAVSGAPADAPVDQFEGVGHGIRLIVLAAVAIVGGVVALATKKAPTATIGLIGGAGLLIQGLIDYFDIKSEIDSAAELGASIGIGVWLVIAGGAVALIGGILGLLAGRKRV